MASDERDPFADHVYFSAEESAKGWAVYHDPKPRRLGSYTSYGLRVPILLVTELLENQEEIARRTAEILNDHWYARVEKEQRHDSPPDRAWCAMCGRTEVVDSATTQRHGWPLCCSRPMAAEPAATARRRPVHGGYPDAPPAGARRHG